MPDAQPIAETILQLATARGFTKTICPSEVARHLWPDDWRIHMPEVRERVLALRNEGMIKIMQGGKETLGDEFVGPIRIQIQFKGNLK